MNNSIKIVCNYKCYFNYLYIIFFIVNILYFFVEQSLLISSLVILFSLVFLIYFILQLLNESIECYENYIIYHDIFKSNYIYTLDDIREIKVEQKCIQVLKIVCRDKKVIKFYFYSYQYENMKEFLLKQKSKNNRELVKI